MNSNIIANVATIAAMAAINGNGGQSGSTPYASGINIPGTIVGNLGTAEATTTFREKFSRYNNYLTDVYGAAQMAADRYMSLKERIPMQIEWYKTPTSKSSITMYINPDKLSVQTKKIESKQVTRGGIYYHIYGDDVWDLSFSGTFGYAQMRGVEAMEEAYHYSGTLLAYQNVSQSTVHTNQMSFSSTSGSGLGTNDTGLGGILASMMNSKDKTTQGIGQTVNQLTGYLGLTNISQNSSGQYVSSSQLSNKSLLGKICNSANSIGQDISKLTKNAGVQDIFALAKTTTGNANNISGMVNVLTSFSNVKSMSKTVTNALAASVVGSVMGTDSSGLSSVMKSLGVAGSNDVQNFLSLITGDSSTVSSGTSSNVSTCGNYYNMGTLSISDLNAVVTTVQKSAESFSNLYSAASSNWSDITDLFTDEYRPRMTIIYFDDRVFIGYFSSFNWNRQANTLLIDYSVKFTVLRMVVLKRNNYGVAQESVSTSSSLVKTLASAATGGVINSLISKSTILT